MSDDGLVAAEDRFLRESCCPECAGELVELPHGFYSIIECARGCGWWDEKRPVKKYDDAAHNDDLVGDGDRLTAAIKWAEIRAPRCEICGEFERHKTRLGIRKALARDHCHKTNRQRGLLCSRCNTAIGLFDDSARLMVKAMEYLGKYR